MTFVNCSSVIRISRASSVMPALETSTSTGPWCSSTSVKARSTASLSVTSHDDAEQALGRAGPAVGDGDLVAVGGEAPGDRQADAPVATGDRTERGRGSRAATCGCRLRQSCRSNLSLVVDRVPDDAPSAPRLGSAAVADGSTSGCGQPRRRRATDTEHAATAGWRRRGWSRSRSAPPACRRPALSSSRLDAVKKLPPDSSAIFSSVGSSTGTG